MSIERIIKYIEDDRNALIESLKTMDKRHRIPRRIRNEIGELNGMIYFLKGEQYRKLKL